MDLISILIGTLAGIIVGGGVAWAILTGALKKRRDMIISEAEKEAETIKKDKMLQAKEKFLQLKEEHEKVIKDRNRKIQSAEDKIKQRESSLSKKIEEYTRKEKDIDAIKENLSKQLLIVEKKQEELDKSQLLDNREGLKL